MPVRTTTVACPLHWLIRRDVIPDIGVAVERTQDIIVLGTTLVNAYLLDRIDAFRSDADPLNRAGVLKVIGDVLKDQRVVCNAFVLAAGGSSRAAPADLSRVWRETVSSHAPQLCGAKTTRLRAYEAKDHLVPNAKTALRLHFYNRVAAHVRFVHRLEWEQWIALDAQERKARKVQFARMTKDIVRQNADPLVSDPAHHEWVASTRRMLGLDLLLTDKPLCWHLKASPAAILLATSQLSLARWRTCGKAYSIFPVRTSMTPHFCKFDIESLCDTTVAIRPPRATRSGRQRPAAGSDAQAAYKASLLAEKKEAFEQVLNPQWKKLISHADRFAYTFYTDGVSARLVCERDLPPAPPPAHGRLPSRGLHYIDDLKARNVTIGDDVHVIGVDPGKVELMVSTNDRRRGVSDPRPLYPSVRYTNKQRRFEMKTVVAQKKLLQLRSEDGIDVVESDLARHSQRAPTLAAFSAYLAAHFASLRRRLDFYSNISFRRRRWRGFVLSQKSIARLKNRVRAMAPQGAKVAIAWGAWGLTSGQACSSGNPPALGVGLMREFAKDFFVVPTPEHHTSRTCSVCLRSGRGPQDAGPCLATEAGRMRQIRGLRFCSHCESHLNRDRNAALNIAMNMRLYMANGTGIRALSADDRELLTNDAGVL